MTAAKIPTPVGGSRGMLAKRGKAGAVSGPRQARAAMSGELPGMRMWLAGARSGLVRGPAVVDKLGQGCCCLMVLGY